ncbi:restriction system protein [Streptomyces sp. PsTaAH-137]|nr:restriction system protein [Streptomyces sp. PsTaAH-137]
MTGATRGRSQARRREPRLSGLATVLALIGFVVCVGLLLFVRFAHWAGNHPGAGALCIALTIPLSYTLLRSMPRPRELRAAARAGMAQADRDAAAASGHAYAATHEGVYIQPPTDVHDGRTVALPPHATEPL